MKRKKIMSLVLLTFFLITTNSLKVIAKSTPQTLKQCIDALSIQEQTTTNKLKNVTCSNITNLAGIEELAAVESFSVSNSTITSIPETILNLKKLKHLQFANNEMKTIPTIIYALTSLESLNLANNKIQVLSPQIANLKQLKILNLGGNLLTYLPSEINMLTELQILTVSTNRLIQLPQLDVLPNLQQLYIDNNQLTSLPSFATKKMQAITAERNLLTNTTINSNGKEFPINTTYKIKTIFRDTRITVSDSWENVEETLFEALVVSNGMRPYGFSSYQLINVKDTTGKTVSLESYIDPFSKQILQSGTLIGNIEVADIKGNIVGSTAEQVTIVLQKQQPSTIILPVEGNGGNEVIISEGAQTYTPPIVEGEGNLSGEGLLVESAATPTQPVVSPIVRPNSVTTESVVFRPNWLAYFEPRAQEQHNLNWLSFLNGEFIMLSMFFGFFAFIPIALYLFMIKRIKNIDSESESIFLSRK